MAGPVAVLWDIDGTLMSARGVGVRAFVRAVEVVTGVTWTPRRLDFGGRTDPVIAELILADAGVSDLSSVPDVLAAVAVAYDELADELRSAAQVLPGVRAALAGLHAASTVQTVVTGNVRAGAVAKLAAAGLDAPLQLDLGGYGSDRRERGELVRVALARLSEAGVALDPRSTWVIGDTPRDLACARDNGLRCALVATGQHRVEELAPLGADLVVADLSNHEAVIEALFA